MAPIDWTRFMALDVGQLQEDAALADQMYEVLAEVFKVMNDYAISFYIMLVRS
jgi:hypothetical protein